MSRMERPQVVTSDLGPDEISGGDQLPSPATVPQTTDDLLHWHEITEWWTDPRLSYARGLEDGYRLARQEIEAEDDAFHRAAVSSAIAAMERVDARRRADAGVLV